jgi:hypothetical protein
MRSSRKKKTFPVGRSFFCVVVNDLGKFLDVLYEYM